MFWAPHRSAVIGAVGRTLSVVIGSSKPIGLAFWLAVVAALSALEALSRLTSWPVPGVGDLVARYLRRPFLRGLGVAVWLVAGWHLFAH